ncbi:unnamed protein product [Ectocarpus sp. 4 AP-2014]
MGEMVPDWAQMWGAKVKMPTDMRDDMLRDAIETCRNALDHCADFEAEGLAAAEKIKRHFDARWDPSWHVIIGRNFGSFVTHETTCFVYFYLADKAIMMYKAG